MKLIKWILIILLIIIPIGTFIIGLYHYIPKEDSNIYTHLLVVSGCYIWYSTLYIGYKFYKWFDSKLK